MTARLPTFVPQVRTVTEKPSATIEELHTHVQQTTVWPRGGSSAAAEQTPRLVPLLFDELMAIHRALTSWAAVVFVPAGGADAVAGCRGSMPSLRGGAGSGGLARGSLSTSLRWWYTPGQGAGRATSERSTSSGRKVSASSGRKGSVSSGRKVSRGTSRWSAGMEESISRSEKVQRVLMLWHLYLTTSVALWRVAPWIVSFCLLFVSNVLSLWVGLSIFDDCDHLVTSWLFSIAVGIAFVWILVDPLYTAVRIVAEDLFDSEGRSSRLSLRSAVGDMLASPWLLAVGGQADSGKGGGEGRPVRKNRSTAAADRGGSPTSGSGGGGLPRLRGTMRSLGTFGGSIAAQIAETVRV